MHQFCVPYHPVLRSPTSSEPPNPAVGVSSRFLPKPGFLHMPLNPLANCGEQPEKGGSIFTLQLLTCAKSVEDVPLCFVHPQLHWLTRMMGKLLGKLQQNKILASVPTQWHRDRHICQDLQCDTAHQDSMSGHWDQEPGKAWRSPKGSQSSAT
ncbi:hypothetical protein HGM15179_003849 [Zosterops borbonicus]|uniref:Uncharacterized protein n=1 Tax=Zosterops borbonicus TaxID=364589 RepID=A0A8K1GQ87_9PASS|nr:hypothetical protein HGM15179_003849 [Zosterops borbonicus]